MSRLWKQVLPRVSKAEKRESPAAKAKATSGKKTQAAAKPDATSSHEAQREGASDAALPSSAALVSPTGTTGTTGPASSADLASPADPGQASAGHASPVDPARLMVLPEEGLGAVQPIQLTENLKELDKAVDLLVGHAATPYSPYRSKELKTTFTGGWSQAADAWHLQSDMLCHHPREAWQNLQVPPTTGRSATEFKEPRAFAPSPELLREGRNARSPRSPRSPKTPRSPEPERSERQKEAFSAFSAFAFDTPKSPQPENQNSCKRCDLSAMEVGLCNTLALSRTYALLLKDIVYSIILNHIQRHSRKSNYGTK